MSNKEEEEEMSMVLGKEPKKLNVMANIRKIAQNAIKEKGLTEEQVRKSLDIKRYEK